MTLNIYDRNGNQISVELATRMLADGAAKGRRVRLISMPFGRPWWHFWRLPGYLHARFRIWNQIRKVNATVQR